MRNTSICKVAAIITALLVVLSTASVSAVSRDSESPLSCQSTDKVEVRVVLPGLEGAKDYTVKLTKENYKELCRIFNDTLEALQNAKTDGEAYDIFNETIIKLREIGVILHLLTSPDYRNW